MRVGICFNLDNPARWGLNTSRLYGFILEMCEEIEHLGGDSVSFSEHHLWPDHGHLTQPLTYCAAAAARTKRIRIGTRVLLAPLRPATLIAEEAAVVDLISGGRLDLGLGAGYRVPEYELYEADINRRYTVTDMRAKEIRALWASGTLTPAPVQDPVPIWMGYMGPQGARRAGLLGEGLLAAEGRLWEPYREGLVEGGHDPAIGRMSGSVSGWVTDDPEGDWPAVSEHLQAKWDAYRSLAVEGQGRRPPRPVDPEHLRSSPMENGAALRYFLHATPEEAAERIVREHCAGAPVQAIEIDAPTAGMPEKAVAQLVQTVCTRLAPLLHRHDPRVVASGSEGNGAAS